MLKSVLTAGGAFFLMMCQATGQEVCTPYRWKLAPHGAAEQNLILGGLAAREQFAKHQVPPNDQSGQGPSFRSTLEALGLSHLLPDPAQQRYSPCPGHYQARVLLERARSLGPTHPYIARLAENEARVLANCGYLPKPAMTLPERNWTDLDDPTGAVAAVAEKDFAYLVAAAHFYGRRPEEALAAVLPIVDDEASPHQPAARLLQVRLLRERGDHAAAYELARRYRTEAKGDFKEWLDQQEDLIAISARSPTFKAEHLEKVYRRQFGLPMPNEPEGFRISQATYDFDLYFMNELARHRRYGSAMPPDWWLRDEPPNGTPEFAAVHTMARKYDGIDWIQAYHASAAYDRENTWFAGPDLDIETEAYRRITEHAYQKWKAGALHWAVIVAMRMAPGSEYVAEILAQTLALRDRAASCGLNAAEYAAYARIYHHAVRALTGERDYGKAFDLLVWTNRNRLYPSVEAATHTNRAFLKLLMIQGEIERIRQFRTEVTEHPLAKLWTTETAEALVLQPEADISELPNMMTPEDIWRLMNVSSSPNGSPVMRWEWAAAYARVLWMRGFVFGNAEVMKLAEPALLRHHPSLKRYFRHVTAAKTEAERDRARTYMVLKHPGLSPYAYRPRQSSRPYDVDIAKILSLSPIEGNWWCDADDRQRFRDNERSLAQTFFLKYFGNYDYWSIGSSRQTREVVDSHEAKLVADAWARFRRTYPPFAIVSDGEQQRLAGLPRASEFLGEKMRAWLDSPEGRRDARMHRDDRIPEGLARLVVTTRYACTYLPRGNGAISRWAFARLHKDYADSIWTAETPYWFDLTGQRRSPLLR